MNACKANNKPLSIKRITLKISDSAATFPQVPRSRGDNNENLILLQLHVQVLTHGLLKEMGKKVKKKLQKADLGNKVFEKKKKNRWAV